LGRFSSARPLHATVTATHAVPSALDPSSARERDVPLLIAQGKSDAQIAAKLFLEESTVKTHVSSILNKLQLSTRVQAVILAYEAGLVSPGTRSPSRSD
jgi:DNA-binding NarL/FixJ family response regulator